MRIGGAASQDTVAISVSVITNCFEAKTVLVPDYFDISRFGRIPPTYFVYFDIHQSSVSSKVWN